MVRTVTQSVEINADPDDVFVILADPRRIPEWAPGFADVVDDDGAQGWRVTKNGQGFALRIVTMAVSRTIDYLRRLPSGREAGAYIRVLPGPLQGSVVVMTIPVAPAEEASCVATILDAELTMLRGLLQADKPGV